MSTAILLLALVHMFGWFCAFVYSGQVWQVQGLAIATLIAGLAWLWEVGDHAEVS